MDYLTAIELFKYDHRTGLMYWADPIPEHLFKTKKDYNHFNSRFAGSEVGSPNTGGYLCVKYKGQAYRVHVLAWLLFYREWPTNHIDHINRFRLDNRITNLRDVTQAENNLNRSNNTTGLVNIVFNQRNTKNPWVVKVYSKGKLMGYGAFASSTEAIYYRDTIRKECDLPAAQ